jgi:transposase-like protein
MNKLHREKRIAALQCSVDGASIRATERIAGDHRDTIMRLMVRAGRACERQSDERLADQTDKRPHLHWMQKGANNA